MGEEKEDENSGVATVSQEEMDKTRIDADNIPGIHHEKVEYENKVSSEDKIVFNSENEKKDRDYWTRFLQDMNKEHSTTIRRNMYEELVSFFPQSGKYWAMYIEFERKEAETTTSDGVPSSQTVDNLLKRSLISCNSIILYELYLKICKKRYKQELSVLQSQYQAQQVKVEEVEEKKLKLDQTLRDCYEFTINFCGFHIMSTKIWQDYLDYVLSLRAELQDTQLRANQSRNEYKINEINEYIRSIYKKLLSCSIYGLETFYKNYEKFEYAINRIKAVQIINSINNVYQKSTKILKIKKTFWSAIKIEVSLDDLDNINEDKITKWINLLTFEQSLSDEYSDKVEFKAQIRFYFVQACNVLRKCPEIWYAYSEFEMNYGNDLISSEIILRESIKANEQSLILYFALLDNLEQQLLFGKAKNIYFQLIQRYSSHRIEENAEKQDEKENGKEGMENVEEDTEEATVGGEREREKSKIEEKKENEDLELVIIQYLYFLKRTQEHSELLKKVIMNYLEREENNASFKLYLNFIYLLKDSAKSEDIKFTKILFKSIISKLYSTQQIDEDKDIDIDKEQKDINNKIRRQNMFDLNTVCLEYIKFSVDKLTVYEGFKSFLFCLNILHKNQALRYDKIRLLWCYDKFKILCYKISISMTILIEHRINKIKNNFHTISKTIIKGESKGTLCLGMKENKIKKSIYDISYRYIKNNNFQLLSSSAVDREFFKRYQNRDKIMKFKKNVIYGGTGSNGGLGDDSDRNEVEDDDLLNDLPHFLRGLVNLLPTKLRGAALDPQAVIDEINDVVLRERPTDDYIAGISTKRKRDEEEEDVFSRRQKILLS